MSEPREWKVYYTVIEDYDNCIEDGLFRIAQGEGSNGKYPKDSDPFNPIHVIEYSAYQDLQQKLESAERRAQVLHDALEAISNLPKGTNPTELDAIYAIKKASAALFLYQKGTSDE